MGAPSAPYSYRPAGITQVRTVTTMSSRKRMV